MMNTMEPPLLFRTLRAIRSCKREALRSVYGRSGPWARLARYPIPLLAPWRSAEVHLQRGEGIGDVLLCTPAIRELKNRNPRCRVHFYTEYPDLLRGLPYIDEVYLTCEAPAWSLTMQYADAIPSRTHLARIMGDDLGLEVMNATPDCAVDTKLVEARVDEWRGLPRPHVLVLRRAGNWTPNKNWQDASWLTLIESLSQFGTVIEIGTLDERVTSPRGSYIDLRGRRV